jgi:hypothetical protein
MGYGVSMSEELSSIRLDFHKRFDDLRADIAARFSASDKRADDLKADMVARLTAVDKRIDDLRDDMKRGFRMVTWMMGIWFSLLTLLTILFKFIR